MVVQQHILNWLYSVLTSEYHDVNRTYNDVAQALSQYPSLSPRTDVHTFPNGVSALLLHITGTIPVVFRGNTYRFPISLWVPHAYPREPPLVYVTPTENMVVRPGQHVDPQGQVYHPYLVGWATFWDKSTILDFLAILRDVFAKEPPVIAKQTQPTNLRPAATPTPPPVPPLPPSMGRPPSVASNVHSPPPPPPTDQRPPPPPPKGNEAPVHRPSPVPPRSSSAAPPLPPHPGRAEAPASQSQSHRLSRYDSAPPLPPQQHQPHQQHQQHQQHTVGAQPSGPPYYHQQQQQQQPPPPPPSAQPSYQQPQQANSAHQRQGPDRDDYRHTDVHPMPYQRPQSDIPPQSSPNPSSAWQQQQPSAQQYTQPTPQAQQYANSEYQRQLSSQPQAQHQFHKQQHPPAPSHKPPTPPDIMDEPLVLSLPSPTNIPAPPIPPNPERSNLLAQLATTLHALRSRARAQNEASLSGLQAQRSAMLTSLGSMQAEQQSLSNLSALLSSNTNILHDALRRADAVAADAKSGKMKPPDIDELLVAPTVVANQLYDLVAEERALADAIFVLGRAVERGRVSPAVFAKTTRSLAREWYLKKALVKKIGRGMGLIQQ